ncbi:n-acetylglutamate synthase [Olleya sp. HaHaR_3_96]|uniref:n-acetylglutamate synthase n=1 Tax=Olleya sp. HaHaR_3_96 TaxID=2745560 RepID=UPI001C4FED15|nr:n-acetylglutamate synthase [Olleya sp. HaHaR_3_96]QXP59450.1 n-acetylglutamate synthase [Olleya sp. HaHaR_3_96]
MNYHNKNFNPVTNSDHAETSAETVFKYKQNEPILTAKYSDEQIVEGHLIGIVDQKECIDMRYNQINVKGELMTSVCQSKPEVMANGKIRLHENWT